MNRKELTIGKLALYLVLASETDEVNLKEVASSLGYRVVSGHVGSMDMQKIIAAVETAVRREDLVSKLYPEDHALYHAILDALHGVVRGQVALGSIMRTAGLRFCVLRGKKSQAEDAGGEWLAVAFYGRIGGPIRGNEHECIGLGINHL